MFNIQQCLINWLDCKYLLNIQCISIQRVNYHNLFIVSFLTINQHIHSYVFGTQQFFPPKHFRWTWALHTKHNESGDFSPLKNHPYRWNKLGETSCCICYKLGMELKLNSFNKVQSSPWTLGSFIPALFWFSYGHFWIEVTYMLNKFPIFFSKKNKI